MIEIVNMKNTGAGKVIGIGLNKTGTKSLGMALEILGYTEHQSWSDELIFKYRDRDISYLIDVARSYNNLEDSPWPLLYKELYAAFPDAKYVLTTRESSEVWFESQCKHFDRDTDKVCYTNEIIYGYENPLHHKEEHIGFYTSHNAQVRKFFEGKNNFIEVCFENGDGWNTLCPFLGKDIPSEKFPFLNRAPVTGFARVTRKLEDVYRELFKR